MTTKLADSVATQYATRTSKNAGTLNKLQSKTHVRSLKYKNPLKKGHKPQISKTPSPPPNELLPTSNNGDTDLTEIDTMDFKSLMADINDDITTLQVDPSSATSFGNYNLDLAGADLDMKDFKSVFDSYEVDLSAIKKISPKEEEAPVLGSPPKRNAAPMPAGAPLPTGAPMPAGAPLPASSRTNACRCAITRCCCTTPGGCT
eukprot:571100_1